MYHGTPVQAQVLEEEAKVVPKREYPALESISTVSGLKGPGELHLEMQQTVFDDFSLADGTISSKQGRAFGFRAAFRTIPNETTSQVTACQKYTRLPISRQHQ